ncbi:15019_t:CDS:1 [Acaulospora colombiana]|uniref:15019_t:CDS:1 n=1 Tax=Acaulospora colombiana TaxID=27376 RepID=A0ACA9K5V4_9GLOM|nr:15019_t:CDS:1 [Acaulospora colombiana]
MTEANSNIGMAHQNLQENDDKIASLIESMKKLSILIDGKDTEVVCDSGSECPIIPYEIAKKLGFEKDKNLPIAKLVLRHILPIKWYLILLSKYQVKKIWIPIHRLMEIVKPEIQQDIINAISNSDISRKNRTPCKAKRKKRFLNDIASESSSSSEFGSNSEWYNDDKDFTVNMVKAKKRD